MSFVLKGKLDGETVYKGQGKSTTPDLQKARVFGRKCDAGNARWDNHRVKDVETLEVNIVEVPA